jgi:hypothetical protein
LNGRSPLERRIAGTFSRDDQKPSRFALARVSVDL